MTSLWIVHREPYFRAALGRLAAASGSVLEGPPGDACFDPERAPEVVVLGLSGDLESELEFAHRTAPRMRLTGWVAVAERHRLEFARQLFDTLPAEFLIWPPEATVLRDAIRRAALRGSESPLALSMRPERDALSEHFARAFADLELPGLLRAMDPRLLQVPLLIRGEPGSGRETLARYVHRFGPTARGPLVQIVSRRDSTASGLLERIDAALRDRATSRITTFWLQDADQLDPAVQCEVAGWIAYGLPAGTPRASTVRWIVSSQPVGLTVELQRCAGGLSIEIPPLRDRSHAIAHLASSTALAWCSSRGLRPRRIDEYALFELSEYPWPGNLGELEAVIAQSLAATARDPLKTEDLILDGEPFAAVDAESLGSLLDSDEASDEATRIAVVEADAAEAATDEPPAELITEMEEVAIPIEALEGSAAAPEPAGVTQAALPELETVIAEPATPIGEAWLKRLSGAMSHEVRNPLTALRTFTQLLPERHADEEFRDRFAQYAAEGLDRIEGVLTGLDRLAAFREPEPRPVDVGRMLEELLDKRRNTIHERRLLVLEELDRSWPEAIGDPEQLRFAFESLLDKALELVPERGDLYIASKRHESGLRSQPSVRILLRYRGPEAGDAAAQITDLSPAANALAFAIAELLVQAQHGSFALDTSDRNETLVVIDLPAESVKTGAA